MKFETEDGNVILTTKQMEQLPYVVLVDTIGARGAAYNSRHKLVVEEVSPALLQFAIQRHVQRAPLEGDMDHGPRERPSWMPLGDLKGWQLYWVRDGASTLERLQALPQK